MAQVTEDKTSAATTKAFAEGWIKHYGWPELVVADRGGEFTGHEFTEYIGRHGCLIHFIDSQSPWQQWRTERSGDALKQQLRATIDDCVIVSPDEFELALACALDARNRYAQRSG